MVNKVVRIVCYFVSKYDLYQSYSIPPLPIQEQEVVGVKADKKTKLP